MPPIRALHVASNIAPLQRGEDAEVTATFSRALVQAGELVTVVTRRPPGASDADLDRMGLARRLDPIEVAGNKLTVREGRLAGGAVPVLVIESAGTDDEVLAEAALELAVRRGAWPDVVRAWDDAPHVCAQVEERHAPPGQRIPASILILRDAGAHSMTPPLRDALAAADRVVVPSASHAEELLQHGEGELVELLRVTPEKLRGIPAGVDEVAWCAARDPHLPGPVTPALKAELKRALRRDLGLASSSAPLACVLGTTDLLDRDSAEALAHAGAHLVFAHEPGARPGSVELGLDLAHDHPVRVRSVTADAALLHRVVAAADLALFAHRYTPHGFSPLFCMGYGTVPVAPRSGAFVDAIVDWDIVTQTGSGFLYSPHRPEEIPSAARRAVRAASTGDPWRDLCARVIATDVSWKTSGMRHAELAREALRRPAGS